MSEFQINDKVVCVDDRQESVFGRPHDDFRFPGGSVKKGTVYCVERVYPGENGTQGLILTSPRIYLREEGREIGFNSSRFRKVHPKAVPVAEEADAALSAGGATGAFNVFLAHLRHNLDA